MRKFGFEKNEDLVTKIAQAINKFRISMVKFKTQTKKLGHTDFEGNDFDHRKESLNDCWRLEHNKNLAFIERQRQRST